MLVPHFTVSKVFKTDTLTTIDVHINKRITTTQLLAIAGKVKTDSTKIQKLAIHYLLPGNTDVSAGDNSYYAAARFIKESDVKPTDTLKDDNGNVFRITIFGLDSVKAEHLLTLHPKEMTGKSLLGKYIDDYNHTVIIPFTDPLDTKNDIYIIELDSTAKVVSATMPLRIKDGSGEKLQVTQGGDYITIKDSVLAQYGVNGLGIPFNSIKSGI